MIKSLTFYKFTILCFGFNKEGKKIRISENEIENERTQLMINKHECEESRRPDGSDGSDGPGGPDGPDVYKRVISIYSNINFVGNFFKNKPEQLTVSQYTVR